MGTGLKRAFQAAGATHMKSVVCHECGGHGMVSDYGNGEDFCGPKECDTCEGTGRLLVTPKGRLCVYPGGPFKGRASPEEMTQ